MTIRELQEKIGANPDGVWGPVSRAALLARFANKQANAVSASDIARFANRLGCNARQVMAVAKVESGGKSFDDGGRPKILYERHKFHRFTAGRFSPAWFSSSARGGYSEDHTPGDGIPGSWGKLLDACGCDPHAAFMACSWGAFQVLGEWWDELGYPSPFALAWTTVQSEADHYELLVRYIERFKLQDELRAVSPNSDTCIPFVAAYNGPAFRDNDYHTKIARAMRA